MAHVGFKLIAQMFKQWKMIHAAADDWEKHFYNIIVNGISTHK